MKGGREGWRGGGREGGREDSLDVKWIRKYTHTIYT